MKLQKSSQFRTVYDEGRKLVCDYAVVFYYKHPIHREGPCFGVVASKRVGGAVERNRAKRLLREIARELSGKLNHKDVWVVLVARSNINGRTFQEVMNDVGNAMQKADLIAGQTSN
jgi:ribonuclease P protein component